MNVPNLLTIFRIFLIPVYLYIFYKGGENRLLYSGLVFLLAGLTDVLDGTIARKYNMTSKIGTALDPLADKLMSGAVLISYTTEGLIPLGVLIILGIKEILMIIGGIILYLSKENRVLPSNKFGKAATVSFYITIFAIVLKVPWPNLIKILILITVVLNLIAFFNYFKIFISRDDKKYI